MARGCFSPKHCHRSWMPPYGPCKLWRNRWSSNFPTTVLHTQHRWRSSLILLLWTIIRICVLLKCTTERTEIGDNNLSSVILRDINIHHKSNSSWRHRRARCSLRKTKGLRWHGWAECTLLTIEWARASHRMLKLLKRSSNAQSTRGSCCKWTPQGNHDALGTLCDSIQSHVPNVAGAAQQSGGAHLQFSSCSVSWKAGPVSHN